MTIGIIDYGVGNIGSVMGAMATIGVLARVVDSPKHMSDCDGLILPGVGSFKECMESLSYNGWSVEIVNQVRNHEKPLLGICLGMQLLADFGWEGSLNNVPVQGLGLIPGEVKCLTDFGVKHRLPHVGWNNVHLRHGCSSMFDGIEQDQDFYFVHSYAFDCESMDTVTATVDYDAVFPVSICHQNVWGVQFHPEKSSKVGLKLLGNFARLCLC